MKYIILSFSIFSVYYLFGQGSHTCIFRMYRDLPSLNDTSAMYFINYITEYIRPIAKKDSWQIREDNKDATWSHVNNNPGISRANTNPGNFEPGGYFWGNNDTTICVFEFEIDSLAPTHKGYYAAIAIKLRYGFEADSAWTCTLRAIPRPETLRRVDKYPLFRWNKPPYDTSTTASKLSFNPILGYSIWRSPNATGPWTRLPPKPDGGGYQPYDTTRYKDTTGVLGQSYYYAIRLVYYPVDTFISKGFVTETVRIESRLSENSPLIAVGIGDGQNQGIKNVYPDLRILPNPGTREMGIHYDLCNEKVVDLTVYNSSGRLVKRWSDLLNRSSGKIVWDRRGEKGVILPDGVYFVSLRLENRVITKKIVLQSSID